LSATPYAALNRMGSLCENHQRQSCKVFTGLSIRAKMIGRGRPLKHKFCAKVNHPLA